MNKQWNLGLCIYGGRGRPIKPFKTMKPLKSSTLWPKTANRKQNPFSFSLSLSFSCSFSFSFSLFDHFLSLSLFLSLSPFPQRHTLYTTGAWNCQCGINILDWETRLNAFASTCRSRYVGVGNSAREHIKRSAHHQALKKPETITINWIRRVGVGKDQKQAGYGSRGTGVPFPWVKR